MLLERVVLCDEERKRVTPRIPAGTPRLLPERGDRRREPEMERGVDGSNVNAQLERRGGDDRKK